MYNHRHTHKFTIYIYTHYIWEDIHTHYIHTVIANSLQMCRHTQLPEMQRFAKYTCTCIYYRGVDIGGAEVAVTSQVPVLQMAYGWWEILLQILQQLPVNLRYNSHIKQLMIYHRDVFDFVILSFFGVVLRPQMIIKIINKLFSVFSVLDSTDDIYYMIRQKFEW